MIILFRQQCGPLRNLISDRSGLPGLFQMQKFSHFSADFYYRLPRIFRSGKGSDDRVGLRYFVRAG